MRVNQKITEQFLDTHPQYIFVFGDNLKRLGTKGAAQLRGHKQAYGFLTKKAPHYQDSAYYTVEEYKTIFEKELLLLLDKIKNNPDKIFLISKLGSGLGNKYGIYESIIESGLKEFASKHKNVVLLTY